MHLQRTSESEIDTCTLSVMLDYLCRDHSTIRIHRPPSPRDWHAAFSKGNIQLPAGSFLEVSPLFYNNAQDYLASIDAWSCYESCFQCEIMGSGPEGVALKVRLMNGGMLDGRPTSLRWRAEFIADRDWVFAHFHRSINHRFERELEHEYDQHLERQRRQWIEERRAHILPNQV
ncbi:hypothetical protein [Marinobacterium sp. BA1]|uniref:hypothetical protein n=1 Tax=Marinobacterium sp. BA1 TaxID=3138931 RepID=UPI0032E5ACD5